MDVEDEDEEGVFPAGQWCFYQDIFCYADGFGRQVGYDWIGRLRIEGRYVVDADADAEAEAKEEGGEGRRVRNVEWDGGWAG